MYRSLINVNDQSRFAFFCIDDRSANLLESLSLERSLIIRHREFLTKDLESVRGVRGRGEYCWTCKPFALLHLMDRTTDANWLVYVDSDMMFFSDPDSALHEHSADYLLTPHRFHRAFLKYEKLSGRHNAGCVAVKPTAKGRTAMVWWRDRCIASCSATPSENTYADQKYLDEMLVLFPEGASSVNIGLNAAPWNIENYQVTRKKNNVVLNDSPLVLFHFQALTLYSDGSVSLYLGTRKIGKAVREFVYNPYIKGLEKAYESLRSIDKSFEEGIVNKRLVKGGFARKILTLLRSRRNKAMFPPLSQ